ncbi:MAG TPA: carboxylesterase family protein [Polyangiaceae bacterium]|nr:carboxylesterase family protein [Polyangiaceae bacterium]
MREVSMQDGFGEYGFESESGGLSIARRLSVSAAAASLFFGSASAMARDRAPIVRVEQGFLEGTRTGDGLDRFLGVPYAAAPVGERRFRPPQPVPSWRGLRDATTLPPRCLQLGGGGGGAEDCLYLNVFVPTHTRRAGRLPVIVNLHGGSFKVGAAIDNDPTRLAASTDTIVVMLNYRLGQFGFLAHAALGDESADGSSGNYGFMDQQAALRWVQTNIGAFGGDPTDVTIQGLSAGGWSVCGHLVAEGSRGLFSRAVIHSASCWARPLADAEADGNAFAASLGCTDEANAAACLRAKPSAELLAADSWSQPSSLVYGGGTLPVAPAQSVLAGNFRKVPIIIGGTRNEIRGGLAADYPVDAAKYATLVNEIFGPLASDILAAYPVEQFADPFDAYAEVLNDSSIGGLGTCLTLGLADSFAAHTATYVYEFDDPNAPVPTFYSLPPGMQLGSSHGSDEGYWFDRPFDTLTPLEPLQRLLAHQMNQYLGAFAERGEPVVWRQPRFPRYTASNPAVMRFRPGALGVRNDLGEQHHCALWRSLGF